MANELIRQAATTHGIKLWQIAEQLHLNDGNFSRKLRAELPETEQQQIINIITELSKKEQN